MDDGLTSDTPAIAWNFTAGTPSYVMVRAPVPIFNVFPDGHITILRDAMNSS